MTNPWEMTALKIERGRYVTTAGEEKVPTNRKLQQKQSGRA